MRPVKLLVTIGADESVKPEDLARSVGGALSEELTEYIDPELLGSLEVELYVEEAVQ